MSVTKIQGGTIFLNGQLVKTDLLIENGKIAAIGNELSAADTIIDASGKLVTPGLIDLHVHFRDPGLTQKETIETGTMAAAHGGYTTVGAMPNVLPTPDNPERVAKQVKANQTRGRVHVLQYATITEGRQGNQLVDFAGVKKAGAFAVSNDGSGVQTAGTMYQAMKAAKAASLPLAAHVEDNSLLFGGVINAGKKARQLGVPGILPVTESAQLARDLMLAQATHVHYHVCHVSTKESVNLIRLAKAQGIRVTAEVSPHHLLLCDEDIEANNSNYKMNPPLRGKADQAACLAGLLDGTIDMIATDHAPHAESDKGPDLIKAANGITGLETAFALLYTHLVLPGKVRLTELLQWLTAGPADAFNLQGAGHIQPGMPADLAIFDLYKQFTFKDEDYLSKGHNTPFTGWDVQGQTVMTLVDGQVVYQRKEN
ncbi:dihydroorotase [Lactobacillus sp. 3B(2020)]|uniref:dihydroorotase n=1 Tax=Lactobacillus sp. 3B(2020) TaxID=2695882 RepID=UPI0015DE077B|nr:dihydroorotase [Lactobacillus sp. 3B(2020)]QLL69885.1 dihydroorotase [Lactobacillus sp. 3B(2020)]